MLYLSLRSEPPCLSSIHSFHFKLIQLKKSHKKENWDKGHELFSDLELSFFCFIIYSGC